MALTRVRSQLITVPTNYPITGSLAGTASYATTASYALNGGTGGGGTLQTGSIAGQTILYNFSSSQEATITGLSLSNNNKEKRFKRSLEILSGICFRNGK